MSKILDSSTSHHNQLHHESRASFSSHYRLLRIVRGIQDALAELEPLYREELPLEEQLRLASSEEESRNHQKFLASLVSPKPQV